MIYPLAEGTRELFFKTKIQMQLFMEVRTEELMAKYDLEKVEAQDYSKREMQQMAKAIFLGMED